jgi:hypothetical protein
VNYYRATELRIIKSARISGRYRTKNKKEAAYPLRFQAEACDYQDRILSGRSITDLKAIESFSNSITNQMQANTTGFIAIPAHFSEKGLIRTLKCYENYGSLVHKKYQVVILINGFGSSERESEFESRKSELTNEIKRKVPKLNVVVLSYFSRRRRPIGALRGFIADSVILSALRAGLKDPKFICQDADLISLSNRYFHQLEGAFASNKFLDILAGPAFSGYFPCSDKQIGFSLKLPELYFSALLLNSLCSICSLPNYRSFIYPVIWASNLTFRLSALCASGGFDYNDKFGEDQKIAMHFLGMRFWQKPNRYFRYSTNLSIVKDPRRELRGMLGHDISFDRSLGSEMDSLKLGKIYQKSKSHIQLKELRLNSYLGNPRWQQYITSQFIAGLHASKILYESPKMVKQIGNELGLQISKLSVSRKGDIEIEIEWSKSPVLKKIRKWANLRHLGIRRRIKCT